jgi:hypothetical protein
MTMGHPSWKEPSVENWNPAVQAEIQKDGSFKLGTITPGDGVTPGVYKIIIISRQLGDGEMSEGKKPAVSGKYAKYDSSGLKIDCSSGAKSDIKLTVSKPK